MAHLDTFIYLNQGKDSLLILGDRFSEGTKGTRSKENDLSPRVRHFAPFLRVQMHGGYLKAGSLR